MYFFAVTWIVLVLGLIAHVVVDRHPDRRTRHRVTELLVVWLVVWAIGVISIVAALGHITPGHDQIAAEIGFAPSAFQFEVGVSDLALGLAALACARPRFRGAWMSATVFIALIQLGGDAVGHVIELVARDNTAVNNVWAIPSDILVPVVAAVATVALRRYRRDGASGSGTTTSTGTPLSV